MFVSPVTARNTPNFGMAMKVDKDSISKGIAICLGEGKVENFSSQVKGLGTLSKKLKPLISLTDQARVDVMTTIADGNIQGSILDVASGAQKGTVTWALTPDKRITKSFDGYVKALRRELTTLAKEVFGKNADEINADLAVIKPEDLMKQAAEVISKA